MTTSPDLKLSHHSLIDYMKKLGYKSNDSGICFGLSHMGLQAILSKDLNTFDERLKSIAQDIRNGYTLTERDRNSLRITNFLDGVEIYFQSREHPELFEPDKVPKTQRDKISTATAPLVISLEIEKQGGLEECASFSGVYNNEELTDYFQSLKKSIENSDPPYKNPVAFELGNVNHSISVGYDPIEKKWIFIDANSLPIQYLDNDADIAKAVIGGFANDPKLDEKVIFSTTAYATHENKDSFSKIMSQWIESSSWKKLHEVSTEKLNTQDQSGGSWLYSTAKTGDYDVVKELLEKKADPNINNEQKVTPLFIAIQEGQLDIVKELLRHKAEPNTINIENVTPLHSAVQLNELDILKELLSNNANPNQVMDSGITLLHIAVYKGQLEIIKELLSNNANPNLYNEKGLAPLHIALVEDKIDVLKVLLENNKTDPNILFYNRMTPLIYAVIQGKVGVIKALLENNKTDPNILTEGATALSAALSMKNIEIVRLLLEDNRTNPNEILMGRISPLILAIKDEGIDIVNELLKHKADPNKVTSYIDTPLSYAVKKGQLNIVKQLLKHNADPNTRNKEGDTPLQIAAYNLRQDIVKQLLKHNADPNAATKQGPTLLYLAAENNNHALVKELLANEKTDPNKEYNDGMTPLYIAVKNGHLDIVKELLNNPSVNPFSPKDISDVVPINNKDAIKLIIHSAISGDIVKYSKPKSRYWISADELLPTLDKIRSCYLHMDRQYQNITRGSIYIEERFKELISKKNIKDLSKEEIHMFERELHTLNAHWDRIAATKSSFMDSFNNKDNPHVKSYLVEWDKQLDKTIKDEKAAYETTIKFISEKISEYHKEKKEMKEQRSRPFVTSKITENEKQETKEENKPIASSEPSKVNPK